MRDLLAWAQEPPKASGSDASAVRVRLDVKTPLAALNQLCAEGLARMKEGVTLAALQAMADAKTDLAAAQEMQRAKADLFRLFNAPKAQPTKAA